MAAAAAAAAGEFRCAAREGPSELVGLYRLGPFRLLLFRRLRRLVLNFQRSLFGSFIDFFGTALNFLDFILRVFRDNFHYWFIFFFGRHGIVQG